MSSGIIEEVCTEAECGKCMRCRLKTAYDIIDDLERRDWIEDARSAMAAVIITHGKSTCGTAYCFEVACKATGLADAMAAERKRRKENTQ